MVRARQPHSDTADDQGTFVNVAARWDLLDVEKSNRVGAWIES